MSVWRNILLKELAKIPDINYTKLDCIMQDVADLCQREWATQGEIESALVAISRLRPGDSVLADKIASLFIQAKLTRTEVSLIEEGLTRGEMLNKDNAMKFYKERYEVLLKSEGIE